MESGREVKAAVATSEVSSVSGTELRVAVAVLVLRSMCSCYAIIVLVRVWLSERRVANDG